MSESTNLQSWPEGITAARIPANNNVRLLQAIKINPAISATTAAQPASPEDGDVYILPAAPSGAQWALFNEADVVIYYDATWTAYTPVDGIRKFVIDEGEDWQYIGGSSGAWAAAGGGGGGVSSVVAGANISVDNTDPANPVVSASGGGTPAGSSTWVQYNNAGAFAGDADFTFDSTTNALSVTKVWTAKGADIARAATTSIAAATGNFVHLTGTTTITSFGTGTAGQTVKIRFAGAGTLTHNATSLILPGAANITTAANDTCEAVSEGGSNWRVVQYQKASGVAVVVAGASITGWTASTNTASPNNTVNAARMLVASASSDADAVIQPKGAGAFQLQLADGTATGGNKRGVGSTDTQMQRGVNTQVASGTRSALISGDSNQASAALSGCFVGDSNTVSGESSVALGGKAIAISGDYSAGVGGQSITISGYYAANIGGYGITLTGQYSVGIGSYSGDLGLAGSFVQGSALFGGNWAGRNNVVMVSDTTDATPELLSTDNSPAGANKITLPNNSAFSVTGELVVRENATGDCARYDFKCLIRRGANAAATAIVGTPTVTQTFGDSGAATWAVALTADTTNGWLAITVTGEAAHTLRWSGKVEYVKVVG